MAKALLIFEDAKGSDGADDSKIEQIYQVIDDNGFSHQVRIAKDSAKKSADIVTEVTKLIQGKEVIDVGAVGAVVVSAEVKP